MVLSKVAEEATDVVEIIPSMKELLHMVIRVSVAGVATYFVSKWISEIFDPKDNQKTHVKKRAAGIKRRLNIARDLDKYEMQILTHVVDPNQLKVTWADVAGLDETIDEIKKTVINPILASRNRKGPYSALIQAPKGVLLYGEPGCGKTLIAKALAKEAHCSFINIDSSNITDKWFGQSEKLTYALFSLAQKIQPCIIFIDEIDALLRTRGQNDHEVTAKMKAQFMSLWDGLITDPKKTVIVLGATNRPKDMDQAILRRLVSKFYVPVPDTVQRKRILGHILRNETLEPDVDMDLLASLSEGLTGSDLHEIARSAAIASLDDTDFHIEADSKAVCRSSESETWLSLLNPFSKPSNKSRSGNSKTGAGGGNKESKEEKRSSLLMKMKDLESAISKTKKAKEACGAAGTCQKLA